MIGDKIVEDAVTVSGNANIPSLYMQVGNKEYYGPECLGERGRKYKDHVIKEIKTLIRDNPDYLKMPIGEGANIQTYEDIIKKFLKYLIDLAKKSTNQKIEYVAITAPTALTRRGMQNSGYNFLLKQTIMELTDLDEYHVFVKEEPVAAAYSYLYDNKVKRDQSIFVFDLGGGTLDVSLVEYSYKNDEIRVVLTDGDSIGGVLWTNELARLIKTDMINRNIDITDFDQLYGEKVEEKKIMLSVQDSIEISVEDENGYKQDIEISRKRFDLQTEGLKLQCKEVVKRLMNKAKKTFDDMDKIVLVGGSSNMPQIKEMFLDFPGKDDKVVIYKPSEAIARGAVLFAKRNGEQSDDAALGPNIREISSHSYGIEVYEDDAADTTQIKNIIFKGDEFVGGRIYATLDRAISPKSNKIKHKMFLKIYESNFCKGEVPDDLARIGRRTVPIGKPIPVRIPSGYAERSSEYRVKVSLILNSDNNLAIKVVEDTESKKIVIDELLDCSYKDDFDV